MELSSARELKKLVTKSVVQPFVASAVTRRVLSFAAQPIEELEGSHRTFALGIAQKSERDYRLAVRVQRHELRDSSEVTRIHEMARGEVDVRYVGRIVKQVPWYQSRERPLKIGLSIAHYLVTAGTLGAFVRRKSAESVLVLSNNHVLANENKAKKGDAVVQPGPFDKGKKGKDSVARLEEFVPLKSTGSNVVDAAVARLTDKLDYDPRDLQSLGRLAGVGEEITSIGGAVAKIGRTTGLRLGRVTAFEVDNLVVTYGIGNLRFDNQIEIEGADTLSFSEGGDSGSLIVDDAQRAVALLFAGGDHGGSNGRGLTYATPIDRVLTILKVNMVS